MKIIKNFLPEGKYNQLKKVIFSNTFPWYFNEKCVDGVKKHSQFNHILYKNNLQVSSFLDVINPILEKIKPMSIFDIKLNLNYKTNQIIETGVHSDLDDERFTSAIFFLNKCNGYCKIKEEKIYSEDNKIVFMNSTLKHTGSTSTDVDRRIVLSMVYI